MIEATSAKSGKCSNFGNCSIADARTTVVVPSGLDFVCNECGKPLLLMDAGTKGGNSKALALGIVLLVLLLAGGGIAWSLLADKKSPEPAPSAALITPPVAAETSKMPTAEQPAPPITGNCSEADERAGLCRLAR